MNTTYTTVTTADAVTPVRTTAITCPACGNPARRRNDIGRILSHSDGTLTTCTGRIPAGARVNVTTTVSAYAGRTGYACWPDGTAGEQRACLTHEAGCSARPE